MKEKAVAADSENKVNCLFVLGMHRSGTSALGGCLHHLGVELGEHLMPPSSSNEMGYWEHQDLVIAHDIFLNNLGCKWDMVGSLPVGWQEAEFASKARNSIRTILARDFQPDKLWAVKDPRLCRLMPLWEPLLKGMELNPGFLIILRHPWEVARSLQKRDGCDLLKGHLLWLIHYREALEFCQDKPHVLIMYDQLLADPFSVLRHVAEQLNIVYPHPLEQYYPQIAKFIRPDLRHYHLSSLEREATSPDTFSHFSRIYEDLYLHYQTSIEPQPAEEKSNLKRKNKSQVKNYSIGQGLLLSQAGQQGVKIIDDILSLIGEFERKAHDFNLEKERQILSSKNQDSIFYAQVYFPSANGSYAEEQTAMLLLLKGIWQQINIAVPNSVLLRKQPLRLDPLNAKGMIFISCLKLVNAANGQAFWNADKPVDFECCQLHGALRLPSEDGLVLMAYTHDPQIILPVLPELPDCPLELQVWLKVSSDQQLAADILQQQQKQLRQELEQASQREEVLKQELIERENNLAERAQALAEAREREYSQQLQELQRQLQNQHYEIEELNCSLRKFKIEREEYAGKAEVKARQVLALQHEIRYQSEELRTLTTFTEKFNSATQTVFDSLTWRTGYFAAELIRRATFRRKEPLIQDHIQNLRSRFFKWKKNYFQRPGVNDEALLDGYLSKKIAIAALVPIRGDGEPSGSAYIRLIKPLNHPTVRNRISLTVCRFLEELLSLDVDIVLIQRNVLPDLKSAEAVITHFREKDIPLVYEIDDDLFAASGKKELRNAYPKQAQEAIRLIIEKADRVITSSLLLHEKILSINSKVSYLPNALDEALWLEKEGNKFIKPDPPFQDDCLRILYMGTRTHGEDLQLVEKAYKRIKQEYGDKVTLEIVGGFPYGMKTFGERVSIEGIHLDSDDYPSFVSWLRRENRWHFGIIPLAATDFNRKKSYLKFLDYSALGLASICSDIEPYREVIEAGRNGVLVPNDTESWYEAIRHFIENPELRTTLASNAFDDLVQKYLLKTNAEKHLRLYQEIFQASSKSGNLKQGELLEFDEESYLTYNPDVAEAIKKGQFLSAYHHWEVCGREEMAAGLRAYRPRMITNYSCQRSFTLPIMRQQLRKEIERWTLQPLISIIMPVYNVDKAWLDKAIQSVKGQIYPHWELCIADDCSTNQETINYLKSLEDDRIKVDLLNRNQGISAASNKALALAQGNYIALLDNDDELTEDALYEVAKAINEHQPDLIYSDEDKITLEGELVEPHFKPDYSPDMILSQNYISHLSVYRKSIVDAIDGFREGFEGSQDYDLLLRFLEKSEKVYHIPKILYHWRKVPGSTAEKFHSKSYAWEAGKSALQEAMQRRKIKAQAQLGKYPGTYRVKREILGNPLVSIIIPFKDEPKLLKQCIYSILRKSTYENFEIIGISNNSIEEETFSLMENYQNQDKRISFEEYNYPFNFSAINNHGVTFARGEHIILLNNDIEIISAEWIEALLEHSQRPEIGAVGGKLYFPNETIQHAGVIIGLGGVAGHSHKHFPRNIEGYFYQPNIIRNMSAVTAACLMIKKRLYKEAKGLEEENLRIAFNDVDFCLRLMERGYLNVYTPYCQAYHHESVSRGYEDTPEKKERFAKEIKYIKKRHAEILRRGDPYYNPNLTLESEDFGLRLVG